MNLNIKKDHSHFALAICQQEKKLINHKIE